MLRAIVLFTWIPFCWQPLRGQTPGVGIEPGGQQNNVATDATNKTPGDQRGTKDTPLVVDIKGHKNTPDEAKEDKEDKQRKDHIDRWTIGSAVAVAVFTGVLMVVGIFGVCLAIRTLLAIERQTEALIQGQRSWILIDSIGEPPLSDGIPYNSEALSALAGVPLLVFNLKTVGATTVKLIGSGARFHLAPSKEGFNPPEPVLPDQPDYKIGAAILPEAGFVKAPNEGMQIAKELEDGPLSPQQLAAIQEKKLFLCAYGFVTYEDSFKGIHETRFSYIYRVSYRVGYNTATGKNIYPSRFEMGGPEAYNRYTEKRDQSKNPN